jgi:TonB family protein
VERDPLPLPGSRRPPPPSFRTPEENLGRALKWSFGLHALFVLVFVVVPVVESWYYQWTGKARPISAQELRTAIRVDVVDLPRAKLADLQNVDLSVPVNPDLTQAPSNPNAEPVPGSSSPPAPSPTAMVDPTQSAESAKRIEALRRSLRSRSAADEARRAAIAKLQKQGEAAGGRQAVAGNILSEGYSLTGDVAKDRDVYVGKALAHLRRVWEVPAWMRASNLSARVVIKIAPDGRILSKEFVQRSAQPDFDAAVERTLNAADPFPAPPESLSRDLMEGGIGWAFPL